MTLTINKWLPWRNIQSNQITTYLFKYKAYLTITYASTFLHLCSWGRIGRRYMAVVQCDSFTQTNNINSRNAQLPHSKHVTAWLKHSSANSFFALLTKCTCEKRTVRTVLFMYPKMTRERGILALVDCISFAFITDISARELLFQILLSSTCYKLKRYRVKSCLTSF